MDYPYGAFVSYHGKTGKESGNEKNSSRISSIVNDYQFGWMQ